MVRYFTEPNDRQRCDELQFGIGDRECFAPAEGGVVVDGEWEVASEERLSLRLRLQPGGAYATMKTKT